MLTTLDEWEILQAVVAQLGGFAPAAKQLNRSQSTISYAIARLQEQLGIKLFEIKGRRAHLTEFGRALLADVEPHLAGFRQIEHRARSLVSGGETEVRLSVDSIFPHRQLFAALAEFARLFPYVQTKLWQSTFLSRTLSFPSITRTFALSGSEISTNVPILIGSVSEEGNRMSSRPTEGEWHARKSLEDRRRR